jgi:hypothetical protein
MLMMAKKSVRTGLVASAVVSSCKSYITRVPPLVVRCLMSDRVLCCHHFELGPLDLCFWICGSLVVCIWRNIPDRMLCNYGHRTQTPCSSSRESHCDLTFLLLMSLCRTLYYKQSGFALELALIWYSLPIVFQYRS